jgi:hypothetical protein
VVVQRKRAEVWKIVAVQRKVEAQKKQKMADEQRRAVAGVVVVDKQLSDTCALHT